MSDEKSFQDLMDKIEKMSVLELSEFVKALEEKFGVTAAAPMMMAGGAAPAAGAAAEPEEEKTSFTVVLAASGDQKINVIKAVREVRSDLGLKEAKDLVDAAPKTVLENASKADAEAAKEKLTAAGATVELK
ncbi:MAG: 50S ribosomal protein L7/L12 [Patescibacteria group bacterium]|jgi:large subunit ribosomal protein L7/L12